MTKWSNNAQLVKAVCFILALVTCSFEVGADAALSDGLKPDVRLLIDISGSMEDSDPDNLRGPALDLIVRLLPQGSKAGVWSFGHDVEVLVEHRVIDKEWRESAVQAVAEIDNSGQLSNIPAALDAALYDFDRLDPAYRTSIILLTDGKVDISESPMINARASSALLTGNATELAAVGIPVHTIALSEEADWSFLRSLARTTGGIAEKAQTAERLTEIFYQSLEMVAPTSRVPLAGKTFEIDSSVREFTALIFFEDIEAKAGLAGPGGMRYSPEQDQTGMHWFRNRKFALVTVSNPEPGEWKLLAPGASETRVTVISDLRLDVDPLPNSLPAGKRAELGLRLRERGQILTDPEVLALFGLTLEVTGPDGEPEIIDVLATYDVPDDGEFRVVIPGMEIPGRYKIIARLKGETLQRELPMVVEVLATATNSAISTRGEEVPEEDFKAPMVSFGVVVVLAGVVIGWLLRRRKQRKMEVWRRRNLNFDRNGTGTQNKTVAGMRPPVEDHDLQS
jgi:hypothetical protein